MRLELLDTMAEAYFGLGFTKSQTSFTARPPRPIFVAATGFERPARMASWPKDRASGRSTA